jgi:hypothetical protein
MPDVYSTIPDFSLISNQAETSEFGLVSEGAQTGSYIGGPTGTDIGPVSAVEEMGEFRKGFNRGIDETQALAGGALGLIGDITGLDTIRDFGYDYYKEQMEEAGQYAPAVESMYDIDSVDSFIDWVAGTAGSVAPSVIGAVISGGVGGAVAAGARKIGKEGLKKYLRTEIKSSVRKNLAAGLKPQDALAASLKEFGGTATGKVTYSAIQKAAKKMAIKKASKLGAQAGVVGFSSTVESGGNWIDDYETNGDGTSPVGDLMFGVASGLTDLAGGEGLLISSVFGKNVGKRLVSKFGANAAKDVERNFANLAVREISKAMLGEGLQEGVQEIIGKMNQYFVANSIDAIMTEDTFKQVAEAAVAGSIGGAMFGSPSSVGRIFNARDYAKTIQEAEVEKKRQEINNSPEVKKFNKFELELKEIDKQMTLVDNDLGMIKKQAASAMFTPQGQSAQDSTRLVMNAWALEAKLNEQKDKLKKQRETAQNNLHAAQIDVQTKLVGLQSDEAVLAENKVQSAQLKESVYSIITRETKTANVAIGNMRRKLYQNGAPKSKVQELDSIENRIQALAAKTTETIETKIPLGEQYRIPPYVQDQMVQVAELKQKAESIFNDYAPDENELIENQRRAVRRGFQDKRKELRSDLIMREADVQLERAAAKEIAPVEAAAVGQAVQQEVAVRKAARAQKIQRDLAVKEAFDASEKAREIRTQEFEAPIEEKRIDKLSKVFKDKSLQKAKTMNDLIKHLAKKISGKDMPYTREEARIVLEVLLPNALNLKPTEGARWLRNSLFVVPNLIAEQSLFQPAIDSEFNTLRKATGWTEERLDREIQDNAYPDGTSKGAIAWVRPESFIRATTEDSAQEQSIKAEAQALDVNELRAQTQTPFIIIEEGDPVYSAREKKVLSDIYSEKELNRVHDKIVGHEGRHRMAALAEAGVEYVPVTVRYRSPQARVNLQEGPTLSGEYSNTRRLGIENVMPLTWENKETILSEFDKYNKALFQGGETHNAKHVRGAYIRKQGNIIISLLKAADKSTFLHETAHAYLDNLVIRINEGFGTNRDITDLDLVTEWLGQPKSKDGTFSREQHEQFARGFEKYLMTGKAPNSKLAKFFELVRKWLKDIYKTAEALDVKLSPAAMRVYRNMLVPEKGRNEYIAKPKAKPSVKEGIVHKQTAAQKEAYSTKVKKTVEDFTDTASTALLRAMNKSSKSFLTPEGILDYRWPDKVKTLFQDYYHPIRMMVQAVKEKGGTVNIDSNVYAIEEAIPNIESQLLKDFDRKFVKPLIEHMQAYTKEHGGSAKQVQYDIDTYLIARHAKERNEHLAKRGNTDPAPSGMSTEKAEKILSGNGGIKVTKNLKAASEQMDKIGRKQIEIMRDSRLLPEDQIKNIENSFDHYVALKGWENMMESMDSRYKNRVKGPKLKLKRTLGRTEDSRPDSPTINTIQQVKDVISLSARVEAGRALLKLIEDNKNLEGENFFFELGTKEKLKPKWTYNSKSGRIEFKKPSDPFQNDPNAITVIDNDGYQVRLKAADHNVATAFTGNNLYVAGPVVQFIGKLTRLMARAATTLNPAFILTNPIRDIMTASLNIMDEKGLSNKYRVEKQKVGRTLWKNFIPAMKTIHADAKNKHGSLDKDWWRALAEFQFRGGFSEQYGLNDYQSLANKMTKEVKAATRKSEIYHVPRNVTLGIIQMMEMYGNTLENMTRLSTFKTLSDAWQKVGMPKEEALERAASAARNITVNFSRRGALGPLLGPLYMFSNASIQGTARMMKTILRNPKMRNRILPMLVGSSMIMAQLGRLMGGDDDDGIPYYDKLPDWVKNTNMVFMLPGTDGMYVKIPLPYGYNVLTVLGQQIDQVLFSDKKPLGAATEVVYSMFDNFSPVGSPEAGWTTLVPTIFRPPLQLEANKGFFGQKIMPDVPSWVKYDYPDAERYWSTISPPALMIANMLNSLGGTTETSKGVIDISPESIEHFVESYFGGVGKTALRTTQAAGHIADAMFTDTEFKGTKEFLPELPIVRRYLGTINFYSTLHKYTDIRSDVAGIEEAAKRAKQGGAKKFQAFREDNPGYARKVSIMKSADKQLRKYRKLKNSIMRSDRVLKESERLKKIEKREQQIIKDAIRKVKALED